MTKYTDELNTTITQILVKQGQHEVKLEAIDEKLDDLSTTVKDTTKVLADKIDIIQTSALSDVRKSNEWWRSTAFKVFVVLVCISGSGFGVSELMKIIGG